MNSIQCSTLIFPLTFWTILWTSLKHRSLVFIWLMALTRNSSILNTFLFFVISTSSVPLLHRYTTFRTYENLKSDIFKTGLTNISDSVIHLLDDVALDEFSNLMYKSLSSLIDFHAFWLNIMVRPRMYHQPN